MITDRAADLVLTGGTVHTVCAERIGDARATATFVGGVQVSGGVE
jgi:hypothetical protein